jgi:hypothetical protein
MPIFRVDDGLVFENRLFEYACHEGNYGLEFILRGARAEEKERQPQE